MLARSSGSKRLAGVLTALGRPWICSWMASPSRFARSIPSGSTPEQT